MHDDEPLDEVAEATEAALPTAGDNGGEAPAAPPATFDFLIHTLFTQALMALGRIPNPITKQSHVNMATARHFVDMLSMLERKTAGNLSPEEAQLLEEIQHQLRMMVIGGGSGS
jgi:hypothetical protein